MKDVYTVGEMIGEAMRQAHYRADHPLAYIRGNQIVVFDWNDDGTLQDEYPISLSELKGGLRTAFWVRQLAGKSWVTKEHLGALSSVVIRHFGLD